MIWCAGFFSPVFQNLEIVILFPVWLLTEASLPASREWNSHSHLQVTCSSNSYPPPMGISHSDSLAQYRGSASSHFRGNAMAHRDIILQGLFSYESSDQGDACMRSQGGGSRLNQKHTISVQGQQRPLGGMTGDGWIAHCGGCGGWTVSRWILWLGVWTSMLILSRHPLVTRGVSLYIEIYYS